LNLKVDAYALYLLIFDRRPFRNYLFDLTHFNMQIFGGWENSIKRVLDYIYIVTLYECLIITNKIPY